MIPEAAVEAAARAIRNDDWPDYEDQIHHPVKDYMSNARVALEAAAPHMLSHERQQTADAHRDAIVNRDTADRLQKKNDLMRWKLDALKEWSDAMIAESNSPQYGRDARTLLEVGSMDEAREVEAL